MKRESARQKKELKESKRRGEVTKEVRMNKGKGEESEDGRVEE